MERDLRAAVSSCETVRLLAREAIASEAVEGFYDEVGDRVGHMPHSPLFEAALATSVARLLDAIQAQPHKVVALDCDNTLWRGVLGEDGPDGITLDTGPKCLQEFIVAQQAAGMLVCL